MTTLLPLASRRSRYLFDWSAAACLEAQDQALTAITGQLATTYTRASTKTALDANGTVRIIPHSIPAFQWTLDPVSGLMVPGLLLEDAGTNIVLWNRDFTNAAWTKTTMTAVKDQVGIDGLPNTASSLLATAGNATALQAITLASSTRTQSAYVKRLIGTGTVQMTTDNGATWTTITLTTAYTRFTLVPQTLANPTVGFRIVTSGDKIAVDYAQNESTTFPTSAIPTTTVALTRAADLLRFAFRALPQAMTFYIRFVELGTLSTGAAGAGLLGVGASSNASMFIFNNTTGVYAAHHLTGTDVVSTEGVGVSFGQVAEIRVPLSSTGSITIGQSIAGAAETLGTPSAANAFASAWFDTTLTVNDRGGALGYICVQAIRIANGVQSLATMRQG